MVYERYIKTGGKLYGPFLYKSIRQGDRVLTEYVGKGRNFSVREIGKSLKNIVKQEKKINFGFNLNFLIIPTVIAVLILAVFLFPKLFIPTGRISLETSSYYQINETIKGSLNLKIKEGEFLPSDTKILLKLNEEEKEIPLSELIFLEEKEGSFYAENKEISGQGKGYGFEGEKKTYPEISFSILLKKESRPEEQEEEQNETTEEKPEENKTEQTEETNKTEEQAKEKEDQEQQETLPSTEQEQQPEEQETPKETPQEQIQTEPQESGQAITQQPEEQQSTEQTASQETQQTGSITGQAVSSSRTIEAKVSASQPFTYQLEEGEEAEIVEESVKTGEENLSSQILNLQKSGNQVTIATDYYETEKGYGKDYLTEKTEILSIDLKKFDLRAEPGALEVSVKYNDVTIAETSEEISVEGKKAENITEISELNVSEINFSIIQKLPDLTIGKNSQYILNLSEYFFGAESYSTQNIENISLALQGETLIITPEPDFTGTRQAEIQAVRENETLTSSLIISVIEEAGNLTIETKNYKVVLNRPVKWHKKLSIEGNLSDLTLEIPKEAENISIKTGEEILQAELQAGKESKLIEEDKAGLITGKVIIVETEEELLFVRLWKLLQEKTKKITGKIVEQLTPVETQTTAETAVKAGVEESEIENTEDLDGGLVVETSAEKIVVLEEQELAKAVQELEEKNKTEILVEYETPAPISTEIEKSGGKEVVISAPDEYNYTDILSFTEIPEKLKVGEESKIKVYWYASYEDAIKYGYINDAKLMQNLTTITGNIIENKEENPAVIIRGFDEISKHNSLTTLSNINAQKVNKSFGVQSRVGEIGKRASLISWRSDDPVGSKFSYENPNSRSDFEDNIQDSKVRTLAPGAHSEITGNIIEEQNSNQAQATQQETKISAQASQTQQLIKIEIPFSAYDLDNNGKLDYIEWITPHLSNQTYEIIYITKAVELDENRTYLRDVFELVKEKDNNYTEIPAGNFLRVSFEQNLTNKKDITIYARVVNNTNESHECYDGETEILTEKGWKFFNELEEDEKVMTLNQETGEKEWQVPLERQDFEHDGEMFRIETEEGELLVSPEHKVYVGEREDYNFSSFNKSSVESILILDCCLNASSSDQIAQLNERANAKYGSSFVSVGWGEILLASDKNLEYFDSENVLISFFNIENKNVNSDLSIFANFTIFSSLFDNSSKTKSGEINLQSEFSNSSITYLLIESDLKKENNTEASITNISRGGIFYKPCLLATLCFNSSESLSTCLSVNSDLDNISSAKENSNLLTNCLITLAKANSNLSLNSSGMSILIFNSSILTTGNNNKDYLNVSYFKLMLITETYDRFNSGKEIYFLNSKNKPIKVKNITKEPYSGKIYDVDVEKDVVLVRRKGEAVWSGNSNPNTASIEVYRQDDSNLITKFENITSENWYKVYLSGLEENESYETFDLKILLNSVEFDYVVDPEANASDAENVTQCGTLDAANTRYQMNNSEGIVNNTLEDNCINITAENITLDCQGNFILSDKDYIGVYSNQINTTIQNCNITMGGAGGYGVYLEGANNSYIYNNNLSGQYRGVYLLGTNETIIELNDANSNSDHGIYLYSSSNNNLTSNNASSNSLYGIYLYSSSNNTLTSNTANSNTNYGIYLELSSNNNQLTSNNINSNNLGIVFSSSSGNTLTSNTANSNTQSGIYFEGGSSNNLTSNTVNLNSNNGIYLSLSSNNNILTSNTVNSNSQRGIYLSGSSDNNITSNTVDSNYWSGILLVSISNSNILTSNSIWNCSTQGAYSCVYFSGSSTNTFDSNEINNSAEDGIIIDLTSLNNIFKNTNMTNIAGTGVVIPDTGNTNNTFLNFSYNNESVASGSELIRKWWYQAYAENLSSGLALESTNITAYNITNELEFEEFTDSTGYINLTEITDYVNSGGTQIYYSPYNLTAVKSGYIDVNHTDYNATLYETNLSDIFSLGLVDSTPPILTLTYPENTTYNYNVSNLNYTIDELTGSCWYSIDLGITNSSIVDAGINFTEITSDEGSNNWTLWCNDSSSNEGTASVVFVKDTSYPQLTIVSPTASTYTTSIIDFNITANEDLSWCNFTIDNWASYPTMEAYNTTYFNYTNESMIDGSFTAKFSCNDTNNNINDTEQVSFTLDLTTITQCRSLTQANTAYTLSSSITNNTLTDNCINITAENITIDCQGNFILSDKNYAGVYSNQINTTIQNCNITMGSGATGIGVWLEGANNSYIYNNNLTGQYYGVYLLKTNETTIELNDANSNTYGVYLSSSSNNTLTSNTANSNYYYGIYLESNSNSNNLTLNSIWNCSTQGAYSCVYLYSSSNNNIFDSNEINDSAEDGIKIDTTSIDNIFKNTNMTNIAGTGVVISGTGNTNNTFLNFSYNNESVASGSELIRKWWYQAYAEDAGTSSALESTNITAYNITNELEFEEFTGSTGYTNLTEITDYVNLGSSIAYYSLYTISATNTSYPVLSHTYNATFYETNLTDVFSLDNIIPLLTIISPNNETYNSSIIDFNITANEDLSSCNFTIDNWASYPEMSQYNSTYFNYTNSSVVDGNYVAKFTCNDSLNNLNDTEQVNFTVDTTAPTISFSCTPSSVTAGSTITCSCSATDNFDSAPVVSFTRNPSTSNLGTFTTSCTAQDNVGNSGSSSFTYIVTEIPSGGGFPPPPGPAPVCTENWNCGNWTRCANNLQERECTDLNKCGTTSNKPEETFSCEIKPLTIRYEPQILDLKVPINSVLNFKVSANSNSILANDVSIKINWFADKLNTPMQQSSPLIKCNLTDVNGDGKTDKADLIALKIFLKNPQSALTGSVFKIIKESPSYVCSWKNKWCNWIDVNKDGEVDFVDYSIISYGVARKFTTGPCVRSYSSYATSDFSAGSNSSISSEFTVSKGENIVEAIITDGYTNSNIIWNIVYVNVTNCTENWQCNWTDCEEGITTPYECKDLNECGTNIDYPTQKLCEKSNLRDCVNIWDCESWSECKVEYSIEDLILKKEKLEGKKTRICSDISECSLEKKSDKALCSLAIPIEAKKVRWCNQEYVEIYDKINQKLVSRVKENILENKTRINVGFIVSNFTGYCEYCFDKLKNYDEEEIDCGGSCPACVEYALKKSYFNYRILNFILLGLLLILLLIFLIYLSLSRDKKKKKFQLPKQLNF